MLYRDYISQFTVGDEAKTTMFNKIQQRTQTVGTEGADIPTYTPAASTKRGNTLTMHPKRWIAIAASFLLLVVALIPIIYYAVKNNNPVTDYSFSLDYMKNLMVDADGVTAYSIRKNIDAPQTVAAVKTEKTISLLAAKLSDDVLDSKNTANSQPNYYLYSTNENYEYGNVEYDSKGIQKVTFIKNTEVTEDVYDDNGNLIDSNRKIAQEEIDGQINKMYTTKQFTYIQFVPKVGSSGYYSYTDSNGKIKNEYVEIRPDSMVYDEKGVSDFDSGDWNILHNSDGGLRIWNPNKPAYYSSALSSSFVIDNFTGYIYKIENIAICGFLNGLVVDNNAYVYSVDTDSDHNLVFTDILPNKDVTVYNAVLDNYGWTFVANDVVDSVDSERKVIYTTENKYVVDSDRNVYVWSYITGAIEHLAQKMIDGEAVTFENKGIIRDIECLRTNYHIIPIGMYEDLNIYGFNMDGLGIYAAYNHEKHCGLGVEYGTTYRIGYHWLNTNYDNIIAMDNGILYYRSVNLADYCDGETILEIEKDFTKLSNLTLYEAEDYYMTVGNDQYKINDVYYHAGLNETKYYHIVRTTTGVELVELTSKSYTDNVFIFQPINK